MIFHLERQLPHGQLSKEVRDGAKQACASTPEEAPALDEETFAIPVQLMPHSVQACNTRVDKANGQQ